MKYALCPQFSQPSYGLTDMFSEHDISRKRRRAELQPSNANGCSSSSAAVDALPAVHGGSVSRHVGSDNEASVGGGDGGRSSDNDKEDEEDTSLSAVAGGAYEEEAGGAAAMAKAERIVVP